MLLVVMVLGSMSGSGVMGECDSGDIVGDGIEIGFFRASLNNSVMTSYLIFLSSSLSIEIIQLSFQSLSFV